MTAVVEPKDIERRAYLSYHGDGLVDTFIGAAVMAFAAFIAYDPEMVTVGAGVLCSFVVLYAGAKKAITVPRLGYVEFAAERRGKISKVMLMATSALVISNVIGLAAWMEPSIGVFLAQHVMLVAGGVGGLLLAVTAWFSNLRRFYAYAVLVLAVMWLGYRRMDLWQTLMAFGTLVALSGLALLIRFVREHPIGGR